MATKKQQEQAVRFAFEKYLKENYDCSGYDDCEGGRWSFMIMRDGKNYSFEVSTTNRDVCGYRDHEDSHLLEATLQRAYDAIDTRTK